MIIKGSRCKYDISNSFFGNFDYTNKRPAIIDARFAKINISNTEFRNFK